MALIFNTDGTTRTVVPLAVEPGGTVEFAYLIACRSGHELSSEPIAGLTFRARKTGAPSWTELETTPIDLSPDAGTDVIYEFQAEAGASAVLANCPIRVGAPAAAPDTTPPSVPANLTAVAQSDTEILLTWDASTDNVGVAGYEYRVDGGASVDVGNVLTANVTGLTQLTTYDFEVRAYDEADNFSSWSAVVSETTDPLTVPPFAYGVGVFHSNDIDVIEPGLPEGTQEGDVLLLFVETNNEAPSVTSPSGWAEAANSPASNAGANPTRLTVFWKRAAAGEVAPIIADPGDHGIAIVMGVRGCIESGDPFDVTASSAGGVGTNIAIPGATTTVKNCLVVAAVGTSQDVFSGAAFSGWANPDLAFVTERVDRTDSIGSGGGFGVATGEKVNAGSFTETTVTQSTAVEYVSWVCALKPAANPQPGIAGIGTVTHSSGAVTPSLPVGVKENDILVMFVETHNQAVTVSGWTEAGSSPASNAGVNPTRLTVFYKRAGASETNPTTSDSGDHQVAQIISVRNCIESGDPFDVTNSSSGGTGTAISIPGATTTVNKCLVLAAAGTTRDTLDNATFSGWTNADLTQFAEQIDSTRTFGSGGGFGVAAGIKALAGAYAATSVNQVTAVEYVAWTGALKPKA